MGLFQMFFIGVLGLFALLAFIWFALTVKAKNNVIIKRALEGKEDTVSEEYGWEDNFTKSLGFVVFVIVLTVLGFWFNSGTATFFDFLKNDTFLIWYWVFVFVTAGVCQYGLLNSIANNATMLMSPPIFVLVVSVVMFFKQLIATLSQ